MTFAERLYLPLALWLLAAILPGAAAAMPPPLVVSSTTLLKTTTTWNGAPLTYAKSESPEVQTVLVEIPRGAATAWHLHPVNNIAYMLEGELRVETADGATREFKAGESFAELVDTPHRGVNVGNGPVRILVVYFGEVGKPISNPHSSPHSDLAPGKP